MSKKKSKQLPITEVQLTPEQIAQAKEILAGLQKDIQYAAVQGTAALRLVDCEAHGIGHHIGVHDNMAGYQ